MKTLKDAIYGMAIGDAMGVPVEFRQRGTYYINDMIGYGTYNQPVGTWSDDTSMALATCYSIKNKHMIDISDIRKQFEEWYYNAKFTPFNNVFDCGNTCSKAIENRIGCNDVYSNGNGSLMRMIPLAFVPNITNKEIAAISSITHAHEISIEGCILYVNIAKELLNGTSLSESILNLVNINSVYSNLLYIKESDEINIKSTGYVIDSFEAAIWCLLNTSSYKDCIIKAINLGGDTDTIAAIAGGLAGIIYGIESIPNDWIDKLQSKNIIDDCLF